MIEFWTGFGEVFEKSLFPACAAVLLVFGLVVFAVLLLFECGVSRLQPCVKRDEVENSTGHQITCFVVLIDPTVQLFAVAPFQPTLG